MATTLEVLTAAQIATLLNPPMVNLENPSYSFATSVGSAYTPLPMTQQHSKSGNITWSSGTNPSRVVIVVPGTYMISGTIIWPIALGAGDGRAQVQVNGVASDVRFNTIRGSAGNSASACGGLVVLNAGDYVEIAANEITAPVTLIVSLSVSLISLATS